MNTQSHQWGSAAGFFGETAGNLRNGLCVEDLYSSTAALGEQAWRYTWRRIRVIHYPKATGVPGEPAEVFDRPVPSRLEPVERNIVSTLSNSPGYALSRKLRASERNIDETEKAISGKDLFDERTILARAQHALDTHNLTLHQSLAQFPLDSLGGFDEAAPQFIRSGIVKSLPAYGAEFLQGKLVGIQKSHPAKQASETGVTGQRSFSRAVRTADDPQGCSFHVAGRSRTGRGSLQRVRFCLGERCHKFRRESGRVRLNRLLPLREEMYEVQRFLLQPRRQRLCLLKDLLRSTHYEKLPSLSFLVINYESTVRS